MSQTSYSNIIDFQLEKLNMIKEGIVPALFCISTSDGDRLYICTTAPPFLKWELKETFHRYVTHFKINHKQIQTTQSNDSMFD